MLMNGRLRDEAPSGELTRLPVLWAVVVASGGGSSSCGTDCVRLSLGVRHLEQS
jgi:hypothetical protein